MLGPYDFNILENVDWIIKSSHKNGIYCIAWNVTELAKLCMNKSKVGQHT